MTEYRVGFIGCGRIARAHARGYGGVASTVLAAGADPDAEQRTSFQSEFGVRMYEDYRHMFAAEDLEGLNHGGAPEFFLALQGGGRNVRGADDIVTVEQGAVTREGLGGEDVETRSGHLAGLHRLEQRILVDDAATGAVDNSNAVLHLGELLGG